MRIKITWGKKDKNASIAALQQQLQTTIDERNFAERKLAELEQQIMVIDAENASLTRQLSVVRSWSIAKPKNDERI